MIFSILFLSSCKKEAYPQPPSAEKEFERIIEFYGRKEGEYEDNSSCIGVQDRPCSDFDYCLDDITDVVAATYKTTWQINGNYLHEFALDRDLSGRGVPDIVYVGEICLAIMDDGHSTKNIEYEKNEKYLLLLTRMIDGCMVSDFFEFAHQRLKISLKEDGEVDFEKSTLCNSPLHKRIKDKNICQSSI